MRQTIKSERDISIDILRAIAFFGLVTVHINPPAWICQLRSFDVPMMVFLAGVSYCLSCPKKIPYLSYIRKRFLRIIIPTWIFLLFYNLLIRHTTLPSTLLQLNLLTGWYVWIMRVFFIIALFAPLVIRTIRSLSVSQFLFAIVLVLIFNELLANVLVGGFVGDNSNIRVIFMMNLPYLLLFSLGVFINRLSDKILYSIGFASLTIYIIMASLYYVNCGMYVSTSVEKYPPQLYYLSYAILWIVVLWQVRFTIVYIMNVVKLKRLLCFVGSHTMWLYFYHIIVLNYVMSIPQSMIRFLIVVIISLFITCVQHKVIGFLLPYLSRRTGYYVRTVFDG